jgi:hypothetical protein
LISEERSLRRQARIAGALYLGIIVLAGFAEGVVRSGLVVPGDATTTAIKILASPLLFRLGIVADLAAFLADAGVAVLLYGLLRSAGPTLALLALVFRLVAHPAIAALNLLNPIAAQLILTGAGSLGAISPAERQELALLAMDLHGHGYLLAGAFFGVHCGLLGVLLHRSEWFPRPLGILLLATAAGYLFETFTVLTASGLAPLARGLVVVTAGVGEGTLCLYLLFRGVRRPDADGAEPA